MPRNTSGLRRGGPGRPPNIPNKATQELKDWAREMLNDPDWRTSARTRCIEGKAPHIETHFLTVGLPKPSVGGFTIESSSGATVLRWANSSSGLSA